MYLRESVRTPAASDRVPEPSARTTRRRMLVVRRYRRRALRLAALGVVAATALGTPHWVAAAAPRASAAVTPGLPAAARSTAFSVEVDGSPASVYTSTPPTRSCGGANCDGADPARAARRSFSWSQVLLPQAATATITVRRQEGAGAPGRIQVRSNGRPGVDFRVLKRDLAARAIVLQVLRPDLHLSVEFVDDRYDRRRELPLDAMLLFVDPATRGDGAGIERSSDTYAPKPGAAFDRGLAATKKSVVFGPGVHDLGYWEVPASVTRVHLAAGALVYGAIDAVTPQKAAQRGFALTGLGVLSGAKFPWRADKRTQGRTACSNDCWADAVKMVELGSDGYVVTGVTITDPPHYTVTGYRDNQVTAAGGAVEASFTGQITGAKVIGTWRWNNDGIAVLPGMTVDNVFVSAFDDAFKLYSSKGTVRRATVWQGDNGAVLQLGWFSKTLSNVSVNDMTVLHTEWTGTNDNWGLLNYAESGHTGSGVIKDVRVTNVRMLGPTTRLVKLSNRGAAQTFSGIVLDTVAVGRFYSAADFSALRGNGERTAPYNLLEQRRAPLDLTLRNVTVAGTRLTSGNAAGFGFVRTGAPNVTFQ